MRQYQTILHGLNSSDELKKIKIWCPKAIESDDVMCYHIKVITGGPLATAALSLKAAAAEERELRASTRERRNNNEYHRFYHKGLQEAGCS